MTNKERQKDIYKDILGQYPLGNSKAKNPAQKRLKDILGNILYSRINKAFQRVKQTILEFIRVKDTKGYYKDIYTLDSKGYYSPHLRGISLSLSLSIAGSARAKKHLERGAKYEQHQKQ